MSEARYLDIVENMTTARKLFISLSVLTAFSANALENQFVCTFGAETKISSISPREPKPLVDKKNLEKTKRRFTFLIDSNNPLKASYINLNDGQKIPTHVMRNGDAYIFTESNYSDNHFLVSVFTDKKNTDGYQAIMSFHSAKPTDSSDFFAPSIVVGRCY